MGALGGDNIAVDQPFNWSGNSRCNDLSKMGLCRETFLILWLHMLLTKCMFGFPFFCFHRPELLYLTTYLCPEAFGELPKIKGSKKI